MPRKDPEARKAYEQSRMADCSVCGTRCGDRKATMCRTCSNKSRAKPRTLCCDCGEVRLFHWKAKRCLSCHNKKQDRGISHLRTKFNASTAWARARTACFERDNYTCQKCGVRGSVVLNAHHIQTWHEAPALRLELSNLMTVCRPCHKAIHWGGKE